MVKSGGGVSSNDKRRREISPKSSGKTQQHQHPILGDEDDDGWMVVKTPSTQRASRDDKKKIYPEIATKFRKNIKLMTEQTAFKIQYDPMYYKNLKTTFSKILQYATGDDSVYFFHGTGEDEFDGVLQDATTGTTIFHTPFFITLDPRSALKFAQKRRTKGQDKFYIFVFRMSQKKMLKMYDKFELNISRDGDIRFESDDAIDELLRISHVRIIKIHKPNKTSK